MICFQKMGSDHFQTGKNCQDCASYHSIGGGVFKIVTDGCGSAPHPEVGSKLFHFMMPKEMRNQNCVLQYYHEGNWIGEPLGAAGAIEGLDQCLYKVFMGMLGLSFPIDEEHYAYSYKEFNDDFLLDYLLFTVLMCGEDEKNYWVFSAGDGFVITQTVDGVIGFEQLDCGEYPNYYGYNFINSKDRLLSYQDGVKIVAKPYLKTHFRNVGIASDGIRFIVNQPEHDIERQRFIEFLATGKEGKIKMLVNRNSTLFKDDVSICL